MCSPHHRIRLWWEFEENDAGTGTRMIAHNPDLDVRSALAAWMKWKPVMLLELGKSCDRNALVHDDMKELRFSFGTLQPGQWDSKPSLPRTREVVVRVFPVSVVGVGWGVRSALIRGYTPRSSASSCDPTEKGREAQGRQQR